MKSKAEGGQYHSVYVCLANCRDVWERTDPVHKSRLVTGVTEFEQIDSFNMAGPENRNRDDGGLHTDIIPLL
jgi:hypothetical protein